MRHKKITFKQAGLGTCPKCNGITVRVYDGDPKDPHPDPRNFRQRCYTCEPATEAEPARPLLNVSAFFDLTPK